MLIEPIQRKASASRPAITWGIAGSAGGAAASNASWMARAPGMTTASGAAIPGGRFSATAGSMLYPRVRYVRRLQGHRVPSGARARHRQIYRYFCPYSGRTRTEGIAPRGWRLHHDVDELAGGHEDHFARLAAVEVGLDPRARQRK